MGGYNFNFNTYMYTCIHLFMFKPRQKHPIILSPTNVAGWLAFASGEHQTKFVTACLLRRLFSACTGFNVSSSMSNCWQVMAITSAVLDGKKK